MNVQAKMRVIKKSLVDQGQLGSNPENRTVGVEVTLHPVYESDSKSPNYSWSQATPSGEVRLYITNPAAHEAFEVGKAYLLTFEPSNG